MVMGPEALTLTVLVPLAAILLVATFFAVMIWNGKAVEAPAEYEPWTSTEVVIGSISTFALEKRMSAKIETPITTSATMMVI